MTMARAEAFSKVIFWHLWGRQFGGSRPFKAASTDPIDRKAECGCKNNSKKHDVNRRSFRFYSVKGYKS
jgi:hypothetical protein